MLPSRGLSNRGPTAVLRHCVSRPAQTSVSRPHQRRQFSLTRLFTRPSVARSANSPSLYGRTLASPWNGLTPLGRTTPVLASRAGASRLFSLWPSKPKATPEAPITPPDTAANSAASPPKLVSDQAAASSSGSLPGPESVSAGPDVISTSVPDPSSSFDAISDLDTLSVLDIPEQIGYLKALGLDFGWGPSSICEWLLEHVYIGLGIPWWGAIAVVAVGIRLVLLYPQLTATGHSARLQNLQHSPEFKETMTELARLQSAKQLDYQKFAIIKAKQKRMRKTVGASMFRSLMPAFVMFPLSYGMFRVIRAMAALPVPSFETGGVLWFKDLSVADPTYILPLATASLSIVMMQTTRKANMMNSDPRTQPIQKFMMFGMIPVVLLCTMWLPAGLTWFFFLFQILYVVNARISLNPAVRRWLDIPPLPEAPMLPTKKDYQPLTYQPPNAGFKGMTESITKQLGGFTGMPGADNKETARFRKMREYEDRREEEEKQKAIRRKQEKMARR